MSTDASRVSHLAGRLAGALDRHTTLRSALLACGIGYGVVYIVANDVVAAAMWDDYSRIDQAISELSGTEAPSRGFLGAMLPFFTLLVLGFGLGVWAAAGRSRALRITGGILIAQAAMFPVWLLFPMSSREELAAGAGGANDTGHLALGAVAVTFIVLQIAFSAAALGQRFRYFSILMGVVTLAAGVATGPMSAGMETGDPTPWMGFVERISYGGWLVWMAGFAVVLLWRERSRREVPASDMPAGIGAPA